MNLHEYDLIILNTSAGKDSLAAMWEVCEMAKEQGFQIEKIVASHQDLGAVEWPGTRELVETQARRFGIEVHFSKRRNKDGIEETLLEYVVRRGKWPSNKQRWCTSDFKRAPGGRVVTALTKGMKGVKVLQVFGFRKDESPARAKKQVLKVNDQLTTLSRTVHDWLPIHDWREARVWGTIKGYGLPYHPAYDLGMPRLSCVFCVFSPFDALVVAGKANPELLDKYVEVEQKIGHTFRDGFAIESVRKAIAEGYEPTKVSDWKM